MKFFFSIFSLVLIVSATCINPEDKSVPGIKSLSQDSSYVLYFKQVGQVVIDYESLKSNLIHEKNILDSLIKKVSKAENNYFLLMNKFMQFSAQGEILNSLFSLDSFPGNIDTAALKLLNSALSTSYEIESKTIQQKIKVRRLLIDSVVLSDRLNRIYDSYCFDEFKSGFRLQNGFKFNFNNKSYIAFIASIDRHEILLHHNNSKRLQPLEYTWYRFFRYKGKREVGIMNAGMYNTTDGFPQGLLITQGKMIRDLDLTENTQYGNFYLQPNGVFFVDSIGKMGVLERKQYIKFSASYKVPIVQATQSGPMLVIDGNIHPVFKYGSTNLNIRNGVGIFKGSDRSAAVFLISEQPVNLYEFALVFRNIFQCDQALYLDGAISKMYINESGNILGKMGGELGPVISIHEK
jgi:uncharacterized protein YigE (DUF2233 family)